MQGSSVTVRFGFLPAINVGRRRMAMADLAATLSQSGLQKVKTFIASGNFVFKGHITEAAIETVLQERFGFLAETFLRTRGELQTLRGFADSLCAEQGVHAVQIGFLRDPPDDGLKPKLAQVENDLDQFTFGPREII